MKTAEARDATVARANALLEEYPSVDKLPVAETGDIAIALQPPFDKASYVAAVYAICAIGDLVGQRGGTSLVARSFTAEALDAEAQPLKA